MLTSVSFAFDATPSKSYRLRSLSAMAAPGIAAPRLSDRYSPSNVYASKWRAMHGQRCASWGQSMRCTTGLCTHPSSRIMLGVLRWAGPHLNGGNPADSAGRKARPAERHPVRRPHLFGDVSDTCAPREGTGSRARRGDHDPGCEQPLRVNGPDNDIGHARAGHCAGHRVPLRNSWEHTSELVSPARGACLLCGTVCGTNVRTGLDWTCGVRHFFCSITSSADGKTDARIQLFDKQ